MTADCVTNKKLLSASVHLSKAVEMVLSFTDTYGIDKRAFDSTGAYDPVIGIDSLLFIDPALLDKCSAPEFAGARKEVEEYFGLIITLLSKSQRKHDRRWNMAERLLTFTEIRGTSFGYCARGNSGAGIGPKLRTSVLETVCTLIEDGITNPNIFELIGVFEENIGPDRISDLMTHILRKTIARYTERVSTQLSYDSTTIDYEGFRVPKHPTRNEPVLLLPKEILSPLPVAFDMGDIDYVCTVNERVRKVINAYFPWDDERRKPSKTQMKKAMLRHPDFVDALLEAYQEAPRHRYDFTSDCKGTTIWYANGKKIAMDYPFNMQGIKVDDPTAVARAICKQFKRLVEDNSEWKLLYDEHERKPRTERYSQLLFFAVASAYVEANGLNIDVSPEPNSGNGPVDFKLALGREGKCLVELKMSSSSKLKRCVEKQIPAYMESERASHAIYLLVQTGNEERMEEFLRYYHGLPDDTISDIELITVDARPKASASTR